VSNLEPAFELTDSPAENDVAVVRAGLSGINRPFLGDADYRALGLFLRHKGELIGGLVGETGRMVLYIDLFWLDPAWRRRGHGARLLWAAEAEARRRGCRWAWLDTYDFQARPFYESQGYTVFAEFDDLPGGHRRWFMRKRLGASAGDA
jgi:GNAT superfamily N-acetyltransferase